MYGRTELGLDLTRVPRLARVPRFIWGSWARSLAAYLRAVAGRDHTAAARHEMACLYAAGYVRACWTGSALQPLAATARVGEAGRPQHEPASVSR
jgi:hypothetical protein